MKTFVFSCTLQKICLFFGYVPAPAFVCTHCVHTLWVCVVGMFLLPIMYICGSKPFNIKRVFLSIVSLFAFCLQFAPLGCGLLLLTSCRLGFGVSFRLVCSNTPSKSRKVILSIASRCLYLAISSFSSAVKRAFIVYPLRVRFGLSPAPLLCVLL